MAKKINWEGVKINHIEVLSLNSEKTLNTGRKSVLWNVKCHACGNERIITSVALEHRPESCGCLARKRHAENMKLKTLPDGGAGLTNLMYDYIRGAEKRNLEFALTREEFSNITKQNCHYCGIEPSQINYSNSNRSSAYIYNGIDRKNNTKGYTLDNVVPCCKQCNYAKKILEYDDFLIWIKRLVEFNKNECT